MRKIKQFVTKTLILEDVNIQVTALYADGKILINNIDEVDWSKDEVYSDICTECGIAGCGSKEDLSLRKIFKYLIVFPSLKRDIPFSWSEVINLETIYITEEQCLELYNIGLSIFNPSKYSNPSKDEILHILRWNMPSYIFDYKHKKYSLNKNLFYAVSEEENLDYWLGLIENIMNNLSETFDLYEYKNINNLKRITFYLGEPYWSELNIFKKGTNNKIYLNISDVVGIDISKYI